MTNFKELGLADPLLRALAANGYTTPTPIQAQAIPGVLAGRDMLGIAQTGTGKTAAFALPILQRLAADRRPAPRKGCRALVLSPTRELASQIAQSFRTYGGNMNFSVATIFGGVAHGPQTRTLAQGVDILVAAPGRLLDHLSEKNASLQGVEIFVLDEADQMLDMGFIVPIRRILKHLPAQRQNLFFSATMPADIGKLADELLKDPVQVSVTPQATTAERVNQQVVLVEDKNKRGLLVELFARPDFSRVLVFTRTKRGADRVARILEGAKIPSAAIHGNKSQNQRERALASFKAGEVRALVATDIAARGIDIAAVSHVVQFELPDVPASYVHRIGRTARAGAGGSAVAFCGEDERGLLRDIEKVTRQRIPTEDRRGDAKLTELSSSVTEARPSSDAALRSDRSEPSRGRSRGQAGGDGRRDGRRDSCGEGSSGGSHRKGSAPPRGGDNPRAPRPAGAATDRREPSQSHRASEGRPSGDRSQRQEQRNPAGENRQNPGRNGPPRGDRPASSRERPEGRAPDRGRERTPRDQTGNRPEGGAGGGGRPGRPNDRPHHGRADQGRSGEGSRNTPPRGRGDQGGQGEKTAGANGSGGKAPPRRNPTAPRNDVLVRGAGANTEGPGASAADLMKFLTRAD